MEALTSTIDVLRTTAATSRASLKAQDKLEKTAKDFEAVFMSQMIKPMWEGVETDGMFGGGPGEDVMKDLLIQEYGKSMVRNDGFGLSPQVMDSMIKMQEAANSQVL